MLWAHPTGHGGAQELSPPSPGLWCPAVPAELIPRDGSGSSKFAYDNAVEIQAQHLQRAQVVKGLDHTRNR